MDFILDTNNANDDRIIYLSSDISDQTIPDVCKRILSINEVDRQGMEKYKKYVVQPIQLHIQSFGGSIYDMWALIDIIEASETPIITYCTGYCMSAAASIFMAGHIRCMYEHAYLMIHQMYCYNGGKYEDTKIDAEQHEKLHKRNVKFLKEKTELPKKIFDKIGKSKEDVYLDAKHCLKYKICDKIVPKSNMRDILLQQMSELEQCECECDLDDIE